MVRAVEDQVRLTWLTRRRILPDVPPTNKFVQVAMVCIVVVRGGKLAKESLYWDQASVLVQVGLLNPNLVPDSMKQKGVKQLPVYGAETAQKVLNDESISSNQLITSWRRSGQQNGKGKAASKRPQSPD